MRRSSSVGEQLRGIVDTLTVCNLEVDAGVEKLEALDAVAVVPAEAVVDAKGA